MNTVVSPVNTKERADLGIRSGDTVRVWSKIQEKDKTRLQAFEGLVLAVKHGSEAGSTFTVRRVSGGVGIEKIFPLYSPNIDKIEIVKRAKVRRSKLYHIREKAAKEIRRQMRNANLSQISTSSDTEEKAKAEQEKVEQAKAEEEKAKKEQEESVKTETEAEPFDPAQGSSNELEETKEEGKEETPKEESASEAEETKTE